MTFGPHASDAIRASRGDDRQQLKWLLAGASVATITDLLAILSDVRALQTIAVVGIVGFMTSMAVAIWRRRTRVFG